MPAVLVSESWKTTKDGGSMVERYIVHGVATASAAHTATGRTWMSNTKTLIGIGTTALLTNISVSKVEGGVDTWEVEYEYAPTQSEANSYGRSADIGGEYIDVWRAGSPSLQSGSPNPATDILGTKVDSGGEPVSQFRIRSNVSITRTYSNATFFSGIWSAIGTRNNALFEGASAGTLLFTGARVQTVANCRYEVTYTFVSDEWYHMVQRPRREADGKIELDTNRQAAFVAFYQPFPNTTAFASLVGGNATCP